MKSTSKINKDEMKADLLSNKCKCLHNVRLIFPFSSPDLSLDTIIMLFFSKGLIGAPCAIFRSTHWT